MRVVPGRTLKAALLALPLIAAGCASSSSQLARFADSPRPFALETYFEGQTTAYGLFEDRFGTVRRQFRVDITGEIEGDRLTLTEYFFYDDGERDTRVWEIDILGDGRYGGRAADVTDYATGQVSGNAFNWKYKVDLKVGDSVWNVGFDDWMFLMEDDVLLNRAYVTRYGVEIGQVTIAFRKD